MNLRLKLTFILVVTLVVALGGSGLFFLSYYERAFREGTYRSVDAIAQANASYLADYLDIQQSMVKHVRNYFPKDALESKDYAQISEFLTRHAIDLPYFDNGFFFLDADGALRADYPHHAEIHGKDFSFRDYFQKTMSGREGVVGQPYTSARTGKKVITFTAYIESDVGKPLGMLGMSTSLLSDPRIRKIRQQKIGETGYNYIFDESRLMILHPKDERMLTRDVRPGANKMFDAALDGFTGPAETVNSKGVPMYVAFYPVAGTDWILATQQPIAEALSALTASRRTMGFFVVLIIVVAAASGAYLMVRSMRDLEKLEMVTASLAVPSIGEDDALVDLEREAEKMLPLIENPEFGPLARKISDLYKQLGWSLTESQQISLNLQKAYQDLKRTQSQILQQEKMASIGQLAAGVAHEINNPLGFIGGNIGALARYFEKLTLFAEQLEEWALQSGDEKLIADVKALKKECKISFMKEDIPDLIKESSSGVNRVRDIVKNLKNFSRVDQVEADSIDLNDCLESTIGIAWSEMKDKVNLERDFGVIPLLDCYPQQINQVFLNILLNATQAIGAQGTIKIKTWHENQMIKISITDDGCGIPEDIQNRIFEPFFTTKEVGEGTGLGMSIAYDIVKKHNGELLVDSQVGEGTTFTIELPCDLEEKDNG